MGYSWWGRKADGIFIYVKDGYLGSWISGLVRCKGNRSIEVILDAGRIIWENG